MLTEDLYISLDQVSVRYVFRNHSKSDITTWVAFPLPAIGPAPLFNKLWPSAIRALQPSGPDPFNFTVQVDGRTPPGLVTEVRAFYPGPYSPDETGYDVLPPDAKDVTAVLQELDIPLTLDEQSIERRLRDLTAQQRQKLVDAELVERDDEDESILVPTWTFLTIYRWEQIFPAGRDVAIEHVYRPIPGEQVRHYWDDLDEIVRSDGETWQLDEYKKYCLSSDLIQQLNAINDREATEVEDDNVHRGAQNLTYILTTANTWKDPIGRFRLTVELPDTTAILASCLNSKLKRISPTSFAWEESNFVPSSDIHLLIYR